MALCAEPSSSLCCDRMDRNVSRKHGNVGVGFLLTAGVQRYAMNAGRSCSVVELKVNGRLHSLICFCSTECI